VYLCKKDRLHVCLDWRLNFEIHVHVGRSDDPRAMFGKKESGVTRGINAVPSAPYTHFNNHRDV